MLVQRILKFIADLQHYGKLADFDKTLLAQLKKYFAALNSDTSLIPEQILFIMNCFKERWSKIIDDFEYDYTLNPVGVNLLWIQLAQEIAPLINKQCIYILMPTVKNSKDYNNLSLLSETERFENFFLGQDIKILYRKRGLCEHLRDTHFKLSLCRELHTRKLSALSVDELTRLQMCKQPSGAFTLGDESFTSFWDFLNRKAFPLLQNQGQIPFNIVPHLVSLINNYETLKSNKSPICEFKTKVIEFNSFLMREELDNVNYLYGVKLVCKNKEEYLLNYLICLNTISDYTLDQEIHVLKHWLLNQYPLLHKFFNDMPDTKLGTIVDEPAAAREKFLILFISLFTTKFELLFLGGETITFWDQMNRVDSVAAQIFNILRPFLGEYDKNPYPKECLDKVAGLINKNNSNRGLLTYLTRYESTNTWLSRVENGTLAETGIFCLSPEVYLHSLIDFKLPNLKDDCKIKNFLGEVIRTCMHDKKNAFKTVRVNSVFFECLHGLSESSQQLVSTRLTLTNADEALANFKTNFVTFVCMQLARHSSRPDSVLFHDNNRAPEHFMLSLLDENTQISDIIDGLKNKIHHDPSLSVQIKTVLTNYLRWLEEPILSLSEVREVINNTATPDYLNSPT